MRLLVISDVHAHPHKRFSKAVDGKNTRLDHAIQCLAYVRELSRATGIRNVVVAGDLFDAKNRVPIKAVNAVYSELEQWDRDGLSALLIPGNHDLLRQDGAEHALEVFEGLPNTAIVSQPSNFVWTMHDGNPVQVCAIPYRPELDPAWFAAPDWSGETLCVAHAVVAGSRLTESGSVTDQAVDHEGISLRQTMPRAWLEPFDLAIVGHVHYPDIRGNILIPGQPWHQHPHEAGQTRGVWVVDGDSLTVHPVPGVPVFVTADLDELDRVTVDGDPAGNIVLLRPVSHNVTTKAVNNAITDLQEQGASYVDVLPVDASEDSHDSPGVRVELSPRMQPAEVVDRVLASGLIDLEGLDPKDLSKLAATILQEAKDL